MLCVGSALIDLNSILRIQFWSVILVFVRWFEWMRKCLIQGNDQQIGWYIVAIDGIEWFTLKRSNTVRSATKLALFTMIYHFFCANVFVVSACLFRCIAYECAGFEYTNLTLSSRIFMVSFHDHFFSHYNYQAWLNTD